MNRKTGHNSQLEPNHQTPQGSKTNQESILRKFRDYRNVGGVVGTTDGYTPIQTNLSNTENWVDRNLMKGCTKSCSKFTLEPNWLEIRCAEGTRGSCWIASWSSNMPTLLRSTVSLPASIGILTAGRQYSLRFHSTTNTRT